LSLTAPESAHLDDGEAVVGRVGEPRQGVPGAVQDPAGVEVVADVAFEGDSAEPWDHRRLHRQPAGDCEQFRSSGTVSEEFS
jgi:hypothetical protein